MPTITLPSGREVELADLTDAGYGPVGNVNVGHPAGWTPAAGAPYDVPDYISSAWKALGGSLDMLPGILSLGNAYNLFNYDQRLGQLKGTPGYEGIASNLRGELPQDVVSQIAQRSAERGVGSGMSPDAPNLNAAYLRAIGLNSLQQQQLGQQQQNALLGLYPQAAPFDVSKYLSNPDDIQAAELAARVQAAAPDPAAAAKAEQDRLIEAIAAGKAAAGGGGGPAGGVDYSKIMDLIKAMGDGGGGDKGPGMVVGKGPNQTVDRGNNFFVPDPVNPLMLWKPTNYTDPGASGYNAQGIRSDAIKNASDYINQIFSTPDYGSNSTRGGLGLDPVLNAVIAGIRPEQRADFGIYNGRAGTGINSAGMYPNGSYFSPGGSFGAPITSSGLRYDTYSDPWTQDYMSGYNNYGFGAPIESRDLYSGSNNSYVNQFFSTPSYDYSGSRGGLGLDPTLNAILGPSGVIGMGSMFDPGNMVNLTPLDFEMFGQPLVSDPGLGTSFLGNMFGGGGGGNMMTPAEVEMWLGFD